MYQSIFNQNPLEMSLKQHFLFSCWKPYKSVSYLKNYVFVTGKSCTRSKWDSHTHIRVSRVIKHPTVSVSFLQVTDDMISATGLNRAGVQEIGRVPGFQLIVYIRPSCRDWIVGQQRNATKQHRDLIPTSWDDLPWFTPLHRQMNKKRQSGCNITQFIVIHNILMTTQEERDFITYLLPFGRKW